jgi:hypothetical protein
MTDVQVIVQTMAIPCHLACGFARHLGNARNRKRDGKSNDVLAETSNDG